MYVDFGRGRTQPGDHLTVVRPGSWVTHHGIYYGNGWVIHAEKGRAVEWVTLAEFASGGIPEVKYRPATWQEAQMTLAGAEARIGVPYDPLTANCEHLVTSAQTGVAASPTARGLVGLGIVAGIAWAANK
jgi:cell wall-associated NlpC family hydrolase